MSETDPLPRGQIWTISPGGEGENPGLFCLEVNVGPGSGVKILVVGGINLGGSIEPVYNAVSIVELAVEKGATTILMPVACRRQLNDLSDDMATKVDMQFHADARDALLKAMAE